MSQSNTETTNKSHQTTQVPQTESEISGFSQFTQVKYLNQINPIGSQKTRAYYSTFRRPQELNQSMLVLYLKQAPELLKAIQMEFPTDPEIRVGLSIKILHNTPPGTRFPLPIIQSVINDLETMIKDTEGLQATGNSKLRLRCLRKELGLVQRYIDLEDTVSLNSTVKLENFPAQELNSGSGIENSENSGSGIENSGPGIENSGNVATAPKVIKDNLEGSSEDDDDNTFEECSIM